MKKKPEYELPEETRIRASTEHDMECPNVNIFDVKINVFAPLAVQIDHKPTGISVRESGRNTIHQNRYLAMQKLNEELSVQRNKKQLKNFCCDREYSAALSPLS